MTETNYPLPFHSSDAGLVFGVSLRCQSTHRELREQTANQQRGDEIVVTNPTPFCVHPVIFPRIHGYQFPVYNEIFASFIFSLSEQIPKQRRVLKVLIKLIAMNTMER